MEFSRQEYWSGLPFHSPGDLPDPGIKPASPIFAGRFFTAEPPGNPIINTTMYYIGFFAANDGEVLYSQQKQDQELTVAQTMNSLLPNSD